MARSLKFKKIILIESYGDTFSLKKELGNSLEFRTSIEISYQMKNNNRIGLSFGHISNANIGDKNPGVEIISLSYQTPY